MSVAVSFSAAQPLILPADLKLRRAPRRSSSHQQASQDIKRLCHGGGDFLIVTAFAYDDACRYLQ